MAEPVFTLRVPVDPGYRSLATEVVARYFDLIGGSESERRTLEAALSRTVDDLVGTRSPSDTTASELELSCLNGAGGLEVQLRCAGRSAVLRHPSPSAAR